MQAFHNVRILQTPRFPGSLEVSGSTGSRGAVGAAEQWILILTLDVVCGDGCPSTIN